MAPAAEVTFRDFAGAIMGGDPARAASVLQELLGLAPDAAASATAHFASRTKDPAFMMKAMGLRAAVQGGTDDEIRGLLADCFGLAGDTQASAVTALRTRYPRS